MNNLNSNRRIIIDVDYDKRNEFEEIGSWDHGVLYKVMNRKDGSFLLMKWLKKWLLNYQEFMKDMKIFLGF